MRDARINAFFGDGDHDFRLGIGELRELQEKCGVGPGVLEKRLRTLSNDWRVDDVREVLRVGLCGGGMKPPTAHLLVTRYVDELPAWADNVELAHRVVISAFVGSQLEEGGDQDMPGKSDDPTGDPSAETDSGTLEASTASADPPA